MTAVALPARPGTSPTRHTVRRLAVHLLRLARWFWLIAVVAVVAGNVIGWATTGSTDVSIAAYARQAFTWIPFSLGAMLASSYLRVHVASGMTRRTLARALVVVQSGAGLCWAAVLIALILLERAVHDALGWDSRITEVGLSGDAGTGVLLVEVVVSLVGASMSGVLVGAVYQRAGGWWGTLTLPLTVAPVAASFFAAGARQMGTPGVWSSSSPQEYLALSTATGLGLAAVSALVLVAVVRGAPVHAKT